MAAAKRRSVKVRVPGGRPATRAVKATAPPLGRVPERDPEGELWSAFGYDTVWLLWGLPSKAFRALSETEQQRLAGVSNYIDRLPETEKERLLREIGRESPMKRLALFRRLARKRTLERLPARRAR